MSLFNSRADVEAYVQDIRKDALRNALGVRETIALTRRVCGDRLDAPLAELRRATLRAIRSAKRSERDLKRGLREGLYD